MIEIKQTETLVCDGCGTKEKHGEIMSYRFQHQQYDGHRNERIESSVELCRLCPRIVYPKIKEMIAAMRRENG